MPVITFMSDFGTEDHYVAAVKGKILSGDVNQPIIDISHTIKPYDISHAAIVLSSVFRDFDPGTIHLVGVDSLKGRSQGLILELESHLFVGFDCGLFSMISNEKPTRMVSFDVSNTTFPARDVFANIVKHLAAGQKMEKMGREIHQIESLFARQLKVTKREIVGNVVNVDYYGNLITNISKIEFDKMIQLNGAGVSFLIRFGRESFGSLHTYFTDVDSGDCYILFNSTGFLQIGINKGNASQLLGLSVDSPVQIEFIT